MSSFKYDSLCMSCKMIFAKCYMVSRQKAFQLHLSVSHTSWRSRYTPMSVNTADYTGHISAHFSVVLAQGLTGSERHYQVALWEM